jgi:hypothetical protein
VISRASASLIMWTKDAASIALSVLSRIIPDFDLSPEPAVCEAVGAQTIETENPTDSEDQLETGR